MRISLRTVQWLLNKPSARRAMQHAGMSLIDGQGAARIAGRPGAGAGGGADAAQDRAYKSVRPGEDVAQSPHVSGITQRQAARRAHGSGPARSSSGRKALQGGHAGAGRQPGDGGRRADHSIERRQQGAGAVQFVFLVDALRHDDLAAADGSSAAISSGARVILGETIDHSVGRGDAAQEMRPRLPAAHIAGAVAAAACRCASRCRWRSRSEDAFPARDFVRIRRQEGMRRGKALQAPRRWRGRVPIRIDGIGAARRFQPAIIGDRSLPPTVLITAGLTVTSGKGAREQRHQPGLAFQDHAAALGFGARRQVGNQAGEQDLVADALFGPHQQALALSGCRRSRAPNAVRPSIGGTLPGTSVRAA